MITPFSLNIPTPNGTLPIELRAGAPLVFLGSNGAGKSRLGAFIEEHVASGHAHRIAAQRALTLNPNLEAIDLERAESTLLFGCEGQNPHTRKGRRWNNNPNTSLLNDFDHLIRALYADQNHEAVNFMSSYICQPRHDYSPSTKLIRLQSLWEKLLPHRKLKISTANLKVVPLEESGEYSAADLSDGERVIFYLIGQSLMVKPNGILIIDEPELHINKSILPDLFDMIERERCDCSIIYLTHDLEFAASRYSSNKYIVKAYKINPLEWTIEKLPQGTEFPEELLTKIIGSRRPVLFVEGTSDSLDATIYRQIYMQYTVLPVGSCEAVIQAVKNFNKLATLHRLKCTGIVDGDFLSIEEKQKLEDEGVYVLPVAEIENVFLLPPIVEMLALHLKFNPESILNQIKDKVFALAKKDLPEKSLAAAKYHADRKFKSLVLNSKTTLDLQDELDQCTRQFNILEVAKNYEINHLESITRKSLEEVLVQYKNKGLLACAAPIFGLNGRNELKDLIIRLLLSKETSIATKFKEVLPPLTTLDNVLCSKETYKENQLLSNQQL